MASHAPANTSGHNHNSKPQTALRRRWWFGLLIVLAVGAAFHPLPWLGFMDHDDPILVTDNPMVQRGLTWDGVAYAFTTPQANLWLPLTTLSHMADVQLFGDWAGGHHLVNLLLHLATCLLLFALLARHTGEHTAALVVTLLFAIHPLRVESVVWIAERKDVLSALLYTLTLWFYSAWAADRRKRHYVFALIAMAAAALAKPSVMTVPLALLCLDWWPLRRLEWPGTKSWLRLLLLRLAEKLPFIALAAATALASWLSWSGNQFVGESTGASAGWRGAASTLTYGTYLWRTLWPADLAAFYPYPSPLPMPQVIGAAATLTVFAIVAVLWRRRAPWLLFGLGWFVLLILPGSGLIPITDHFAPDRYIYLGQVGLFVALVWSVRSWLQRPGPAPARSRRSGALVLATVLVCAALATATARQSWLWKDGPTLWNHTLAVTERNYIAHQQLGIYELQAGRVREGIAHLQAAIEIEPRNPAPYGNLALALARVGQADAALQVFRRAGPDLSHRDRFVTELLGAFDAYGQGASAAAIGVIKSWLEQHPADFNRTLELGHRLYAGGNHAKALQAYQRAVGLDPDDPDATGSLGAMWLQMDAADKAVPLLEQTAHNPADSAPARTRHTLAQARLMAGDFTGALTDYELAHRAAPDNGLVRLEYAQVLLDSSRPEVFDPGRALAVLGAPAGSQANEGLAGFVLSVRMIQARVRAHEALGQDEEAQAQAALALGELVRWREIHPADGASNEDEPMESLHELEAWFEEHIDQGP